MEQFILNLVNMYRELEEQEVDYVEMGFSSYANEEFELIQKYGINQINKNLKQYNLQLIEDADKTVIPNERLFILKPIA